MNEIIFILQIGVIVIAVMGARSLGKGALTSLGVILAIFANFFVLKQISLFGWTVTCSDAYAIGHLMSLNLLQQIEGKKTAQQTIVLSFSAMLLFALFSQLHLSFKPSSVDLAHTHYFALLGVTPRLLAASMITFYGVQKLDLFLFGKFLQVLPHVSWRLRSLLSLSISQGFDTLAFTLLGLYGVVDNWISIFWMSLIVKCSVIGMMTVMWQESRKKSYEL